MLEKLKELFSEFYYKYKYTTIALLLMVSLIGIYALYHTIIFITRNLGAVIFLTFLSISIYAYIKYKYIEKEREDINLEAEAREQKELEENRIQSINYLLIAQTLFKVINDSAQILKVYKVQDSSQLFYPNQIDTSLGFYAYNYLLEKNGDNNAFTLQEVLQRLICNKLENNELPWIQPAFVDYNIPEAPAFHKQNLNVVSVKDCGNHYIVTLTFGSKDFFDYKRNLQIKKIECPNNINISDKDF